MKNYLLTRGLPSHGPCVTATGYYNYSERTSEKRVSLQHMLNLKCGSFSFWTVQWKVELFYIWIQKYTTLHYMHGRDKEIGRLEVRTTLFLPWNPLMHRFLMFSFCAFSSDHQPWFPSFFCPVSSDQPLLQPETIVPSKVSFVTS